jgi:hypothetical protein
LRRWPSARVDAPELHDRREPRFELVGTLSRSRGLFAQRRQLACVREIEQHKDGEPDDRSEADV